MITHAHLRFCLTPIFPRLLQVSALPKSRCLTLVVAYILGDVR